MEPEIVIAWVSSVLGSTAIGAWFTSRVGLKKLPNEERTSKADAAETITNSAIALTASWESRFNEVLGRVEKLEAHTEKQDGIIAKLRTHIDKWVSWSEVIHTGWEELRKLDSPPTPPDLEGDSHSI